MKLIGAILVLLSAGYGYFVYRHSTRFTLRLLREIADDLPLLQCRICVHRCALPRILAEDLGHGLSGRYLWLPLAADLTHTESSFSECWDRVMDELPPLIAQRLSPLGTLLPVGGNVLESAIEEIHEQLVRLPCEQQKKQQVSLRISAAVCFSAAALFILVMI
ncbi:MAG: hypothetical protein IKM11_05505 [Oscillospiraceae bacterium]|nr:hypothetical protein [Oscillospiraceae bacterium]